MKVALKEDVENLGKKGDIKEVADGYARNYLIPKGLVEIATEAVIKRTEKVRVERAAEEEKQKEKLSKLAEKVSGQNIKIKAKAEDDGKLFGSVSATDIAKAITDKTKTEVNKKMIILSKSIKKVGDHVVKVKFVDNVEAELTIKITAE